MGNCHLEYYLWGVGSLKRSFLPPSAIYSPLHTSVREPSQAPLVERMLRDQLNGGVNHVTPSFLPRHGWFSYRHTLDSRHCIWSVFVCMKRARNPFIQESGSWWKIRLQSMWTEEGIIARDNGGHMQAKAVKASLLKDKNKCAERSSQDNIQLYREKNRDFSFCVLTLHEAWLFCELPGYLPINSPLCLSWLKWVSSYATKVL